MAGTTVCSAATDARHVGEMYLWSYPTIDQRYWSISTICETDQCDRKRMSAKTYISKLLIALVIIREDSECSSPDLEVYQHITRKRSSRTSALAAMKTGRRTQYRPCTYRNYVRILRTDSFPHPVCPWASAKKLQSDIYCFELMKGLAWKAPLSDKYANVMFSVLCTRDSLNLNLIIEGCTLRAM